MTGWDLVTAAQQRIGNFWTLTQSQVYRELRAMAKDELVVAGAPERRERRPYKITPEGRAAFHEWVWREPGREQVRFPLLVTIMFARHLSAARLREIVANHRTIHERRLAEYEERRQALRRDPNADEFRTATLEFGIGYECAVLDWFDRLPAIMPALSQTP
jgi:DNA-binding PadR family transcriptional regulator